jgi:predicted RecB family nuclease
MQKSNSDYLLSATDLIGDSACPRLSELNRAVADGQRKPPARYPDPSLDALIERGRIHEAAYVTHCKNGGAHVVDLSDPDQIAITEDLLTATRKAMESGADIIVQGALRSGTWVGRPDILRRINKPGAHWAWSYEALDTKLAREARAGAVLQLCLYSELLEGIQGVAPDYAWVVMPGEPFTEQAFRLAEFAAYYRRVKDRLLRRLTTAPAETYPEPVEYCEVCRWFAECDAKRRADDHLSFVAGLGKTQAAELRDQGINTLTALAQAPLPLSWKPKRGAAETFERVREQARVQLEARVSGKPVFEVLASIPGQGLALLPAPNDGDIFLDLEGDPFVQPNGLEYLFGYVVKTDAGDCAYNGVWATTPAEEKAAFEAFIDFVIARQKIYPELRIYHYAAYEPGAFKRLMGRYATREQELDGLLRSECFVDLYSVVRNGVRCGVKSYSIKRLEVFYGFERDAALPDANKALTRVQTALEFGEGLDAFKDDCLVVARYNEDDCRSLIGLRDWLEQIRTAQIAAGASMERPAPKTAEPPEPLSAQDQAVADLVEELCRDVPVDVSERSADQHGRWLLAQNLSWHRREQKAAWWPFYDLAKCSEEELLDTRAGLAGLSFLDVIEDGRAPVHRYSFPPQETDLRSGAALYAAGGEKVGTLAEISIEDGWIDIKKHQVTVSLHPTAIFGIDQTPGTAVLSKALMRIGAHGAVHGLNDDGPYAAAGALLTRKKPTGDALLQPGETTLAAALRLSRELPSGILPTQGPPGAGKTFTGAHMICALVAAGKKVGVTANSHKVIGHLIEEALKAANQHNVAMACVQKVTDPPTAAPPNGLSYVTDNARAFDALANDAHVLGGTAWLWARPEAQGVVDVLFVDEAAQMSLANVLAVSHAAPLIVMLGDPRQLEQPMRASHPEGTDVSALDHILAGAQTIAPDRGLFLAETWRLHPDICQFTSELFYEDRLKSLAGLEGQTLNSKGRLRGSGLRYLPVTHTGNQNTSREEIEAIARLVEDILSQQTTWVDRHGVEKPITLDDILIVAPYNAQVFELKRRLGQARIGTVDKFQGQEAPIVIYSMTTSSSAEAPRGMEFLYSLNRLNVATSRARCACVLVASPALFEADCRSPRQMQLANALCRYRELATLL